MFFVWKQDFRNLGRFKFYNQFFQSRFYTTQLIAKNELRCKYKINGKVKKDLECLAIVSRETMQILIGNRTDYNKWH